MRDQLLKAGLINKKQANEVERQQQRQERQPRPKQPSARGAERNLAPQRAQVTKVARDQALNRQQRDKAEKKALLAQIKQLIEQNRLPTPQGDEYYSFVDGSKVRRLAVDASIRASLSRGELAIVHHDARYDLVPAAIAARIRERDERAVVAIRAAKESPESDDGYQGFSVPDHLVW